jgi:hypothetical protein
MDAEREARNRFYQRLATTTRVLNVEIKNEIVDQNAVDTGRMKNTTKVKVSHLDQQWIIRISDLKTTYYFKYVDQGLSRKYYNRTKRRNILGNFMKRKKVEDALEKLVDAQVEWLLENQFKTVGL